MLVVLVFKSLVVAQSIIALQAALLILNRRISNRKQALKVQEFKNTKRGIQ